MGAIALMRIGVDDQYAQSGTLLLEGGAGDSDIVQHAEAEAAIGEGMMGPSTEVHCHTILERGAGREHGAVGLPPTSL
jgi:hypothetical protein